MFAAVLDPELSEKQKELKDGEIGSTFSSGRAALQRAVLMFFRKWDSS